MRQQDKAMTITGCAGFIGSAATRHFRERGWFVRGIDWRIPKEVIWDSFQARDIAYAEPESLDFHEGEIVLHLAAQTAVTRSIKDPIRDAYTNVVGTLRIAQAAADAGARVLFTSTNKVYGSAMKIAPTSHLERAPCPETPYGVSKYAAECYLRDLLPPAALFILRMSCIYGEEQAGSEDQGWVAHLRNLARTGREATCYGDGTQRRDLLHVEDLLRLFEMIARGEIAPGLYDVGGGPENVRSFHAVTDLFGVPIKNYDAARRADQVYFCADIGPLQAQGWSPLITANRGLRRMVGRTGEKKTRLVQDENYGPLRKLDGGGSDR